MRRRALVTVVAVVIAIIVWWLAREHLSLERIVEQDKWLRSRIEEQPLVATAIGFLIYATVSLFPGTSGKSILCGWLFGFWLGLAMVATALTVAGCAGFLLSRYLFRDMIRLRFAQRIEVLDRHLRREGSFYMLTLRMLHVPFTLVNYSAGASGLPLSTFAWSTMVGLIPSTMIFVGVGSTLPTLEQLIEEGVSGVFSPALMAALVLMGAAPFLMRWLLRTLRPDSKSKTPNGSSLA